MAAHHSDYADRIPPTRVDQSMGVQVGSDNHLHVYRAEAGPRWPVRDGVLPLAADHYQHRDMSVTVEESLGEADTVMLVPAAATIVAGMGGVGKTQIAANYVRPLWHDSAIDVAVWITATDRDTIVSSYARTARALHLVSRDDEVERAAVALLNWLATTDRRWVIVLDDLQVPSDLAQLWPPHSATGQTVVTTRRRDAALARADRRIVEVTPYTAAESRSYLSARLAAHPTLLDGAADLAEELHHLPLALAQASAYLIDTQITCADYRGKFRAGSDLTPDQLPDDHQRTVDRTWELSIELADSLTPAGVVRPLLELLSLLDPNGVPAALITTEPVLAYLAERIDRPVSEDDAKRSVSCLHRLSLATTDTTQPQRGIRVHALIQRATRTAMRKIDLAKAAVAAADALYSIWPDIERDTDLTQSLRNNTTTLDHHASLHLWHPDAHPLLFRHGRSVGETGLVQSATTHFHNLASIATTTLGADHPDTLSARSNLAYLRGASGDVAGAIGEYKQLLTDQLRVLGADHPYTLTTRGNLAYWRGARGDVASATAEYEQLLTDRLRVLGPDHPYTLTTRNNLARWRGEKGDVAGAIAEYEQLLTDQLRVLGADHPDTLTTRNNLARWRGEKGDVAGATAEYERLLSDLLRVLGADHPYTLTTRGNLAYLRGASGDVAGATAEYERLLTDQLRVLGADHPDTLTTRSNLARWRGEKGDVAGATAEYEQLLTDQLRVLGADHPYTLTTRGNLAYLRGASGDVAGAIAEFERLLADQLRVLGADHPYTLTTRSNLARWRGERGDVAGAIAEFERLLADQLRVLGADHPDTLTTRGHLARWRGEKGDVAGAIAEYEQLLTDRLRVLGADHPDTLTTRNNLARWRGEKGDVAGAIAEYEQLLTDQLRVLGADHPDTLTTRNNLVYWRKHLPGETGNIR
ncbi:FxSxx-COOH system tetratricopeptide repeat protein [Actinophytocola sp. KF-1]